MVHLALLFLANEKLLVVKVLFLTHQDLQPNSILGVNRCKWSAEACDSSLGLLNIVFEKVSIDNHVNHRLVGLAVGHEHTEAVLESV